MGFINNITNWFGMKAEPASSDYAGNGVDRQLNYSKADEGVFKAYIPGFLYKPPFGYPRKDNVFELKKLGQNPYIFSIIKTLNDEITSMEWKLEVKEEFQEDGTDYSEKIKEASKFFNNPNGNDASFSSILRKVVTDILEIDSGVLVKVFNVDGQFKQIEAYDGGTFLKNPDVYGYMGNKSDFVPPLPDGFRDQEIDIFAPTTATNELMRRYDLLYRGRAAYFQYGWTAGAMPVPFGRREVVYLMQNPRGDSIYGTPPLRILNTIVLSLIYGSEFNLDFYTNSNIPEGIIQLLGANNDQIKQFRENFDGNFRFKDQFGIKRKKFFKFPITSQEAKFTPFQISSKDMEVLEQQKWFTKIAWMCFGVNAEEMGFTEDSNKSTGQVQSAVFKRKAIRPLLKLLEYHINTQIVPEFFPIPGKDPSGIQKVLDPCDVPIKFCFDDYDMVADKQVHDLLEQEIRMGVKTPLMAAKELGINVEELKTEIEAQKPEMEEDIAEPKEDDEPEQITQEPEEKAKPISEKPVIDQLDEYIDGVAENIAKAIESVKVR